MSASAATTPPSGRPTFRLCSSLSGSPERRSCASRAATRPCSAAPTRRSPRRRPQGVACTIVPGITAALAAAAALGVSLTERDRARRLQFITAHAADGSLPQRLDWAALVDPDATTAVYMGVKTLPALVERLLGEGLDPSTPAVMVENASLPEERRFVADLAAMPALIEARRRRGRACCFMDARSTASGAPGAALKILLRPRLLCAAFPRRAGRCGGERHGTRGGEGRSARRRRHRGFRFRWYAGRRGAGAAPRRRRGAPRLHPAGRGRSRPLAFRAADRRHAAFASHCVPLDDRRLWRPWRRLGRRDEPDPSALGARPRPPRRRSAMARARRVDARLRPHPAPRGIYGPGRNLLSSSAKATRGGSSRRARCSTARMSRISRKRWADPAGGRRGRRLERRRRRSRPAAGRHRLRRRAARHRAAAERALRDRGDDADGASFYADNKRVSIRSAARAGVRRNIRAIARDSARWRLPGKAAFRPAKRGEGGRRSRPDEGRSRHLKTWRLKIRSGQEPHVSDVAQPLIRRFAPPSPALRGRRGARGDHLFPVQIVRFQEFRSEPLWRGRECPAGPLA